MEEIMQKLTAIVEKKVKGQTIGLDTDLSTLGFDSLDKAEIIINIEDEFGIEFSEDEMASIKTVGDLVNYIQAKVK